MSADSLSMSKYGADCTVTRVGILVARDVGIGLAVDVRVVAVGELHGADEVGLVRDDRAVRDRACERDVELHLQLTECREIQVADVDEARAVRAAVRIRGTGVGAGRQRAGNERERAGREHDRRVHRTQVVRECEVVERHVGALQPQRVAQHVAGLGRRRGVRAAREVRDRLLEEVAVQRHGARVRVLVIRDADGAVRQSARVDDALGVGVVVVRPLRGTDDVRQRDAVLAIRVEPRAVGDDQPLVRRDRSRRGAQVQRQLADRRIAVSNACSRCPRRAALCRSRA